MVILNYLFFNRFFKIKTSAYVFIAFSLVVFSQQAYGFEFKQKKWVIKVTKRLMRTLW